MAAVCMKSYSARQFTDACKCQNPKETIALVEKCFYKYLIFFFSKPKTPKSWSEAVFVLYKQCDLEVWVISEHIFLEAGIWLAVHSLCQLVESCVVYHRFKAKALNRSCLGACGQNENVVIFTTAWKQLGVTQSKGTDQHRAVDLVVFRCNMYIQILLNVVSWSISNWPSIVKMCVLCFCDSFRDGVRTMLIYLSWDHLVICR